MLEVWSLFFSCKSFFCTSSGLLFVLWYCEDAI
uniref:Uncharacterized protein n=1 Tax=Utricularia reniformis TaxID=192314 RepID=A0A1Y0B0Z2_9LAMI|nr:hypothetical protein AEK19_MT0813 [Utricularia reniformis]ART31048.1 hypothetical protein AEK19_MT0813 [Utricularia reniformis]